jgi:hypothetical protein
VEAAWGQWVAIGSPARQGSGRAAQKIVDPEALVMLSLALRDAEPRLMEMVKWWARVGASLTNVQRMRNIASETGESGTLGIALFSSWAAAAGHRAWQRYAKQEMVAEREPRYRTSKGPRQPTLSSPSSLMIRMRAAFGVSAKPDVLTFLLGLRGSRAIISDISRAVGYTTTAVRSALKDMTLAQLVQQSMDRPASYSASSQPWVGNLDSRGTGGVVEGPQWAMWVSLFGFLITAHELAESVLQERESDYMASSLARDAVERYGHAFEFHRIPVPPADRYPGREFVQAFSTLTESVTDWIGSNS